MLGPELMAHDLTLAPDPESVRHFLGRLRQDSPSAYQSLMTTPAALRCAVSLFSCSRFLSEAVLRDPERLLRVAALTRSSSPTPTDVSARASREA